MLQPPHIPWEQVLAGDLRWAVNDASGMVFHSYRKPSRRQDAVKDVVMPSMRKPLPFVCVVGDSSGSMMQKLPYVRGVVEDVCYSMGCRVAFLSTDAEVHGGVQNVHEGRGIKLAGLGGTNMAVGIEYAMTNVRPRPDVVVVITDCDTPWPLEEPGTRVVVCAVGAREADIADIPSWAKVVHVDLGDEEEEEWL